MFRCFLLILCSLVMFISIEEVEGKAFDGIHLCFSCLPSDLEGAVRQSGQASASFVSSGGMRAIVCVKNKQSLC